ncbi:MAG: FKBP-type peptidyl-prolyl cis-trans isomerase [Treponema sp.]
MNKLSKLVFFLISFFVCVLALPTSCNKTEEAKMAEGNEESVNNEEKTSMEVKEEMELSAPTAKEIGYAYGVILAKAVKMNNLAIDAGAVYKGLLDNIELANADIDTSEQEKTLSRAFNEAKKMYAAENKEKQDAFLNENKGKEGVITLDSGIQYEVLEKGDENGKKPTKESTIKVVYEGKFLDGKVFDSSPEEGAELPLERMIEGWKELLPLMTIGTKIKAYIPAAQGYGEQGIKYQGQEIIPPNALLIFEIKLIDIVEAKAETSQE